MASTGTCKYCGSTILSSDAKCPNCGAANPLYVEDTPTIITDPKTIAELQEYCAERGMPLLRMRFFIGEDIHEAKAFGIFQNEKGEFVVYKNKADGSRAVRYQGRDEAFAVGEIYQKLLSECHARGIYPDGKPESVQQAARSGKRATASGQKLTLSQKIVGIDVALSFLGMLVAPELALSLLLISLAGLGIAKIVRKKCKKRAILGWLVVAVLCVASSGLLISSWIEDLKYPQGYYQHEDQVYYRYNSNWYTAYDDDWIRVNDSSVYGLIGEEEYVQDGYSDDWDFIQFTDSDTYQDILESEQSSSSSSDYDSWDSGSTDWDSDW